MKTIIYSLIAILIFGYVAVGFTNKSSTNNSILIQATDKRISSVALSQSAGIISDRLRDYSTEKFTISVIQEKYQIQVILTDSWDVKTAENLLIKKGEFAFYETYDHQRLTELLHGENHLFSLFNDVDPNGSDTKIGCTTIAEVDRVNDYLNSLGLGRQCKFAWSQGTDDAKVCLFALRSDNEKGALLKGTDIENMRFAQDQASKDYYIDIKFKKAATALWSDATKRNIGKMIALVLDNNVIFYPRVNEAIENGSCQISGNFTLDEVRYITALGNHGELPVNFEVIR